MLLTQNCHWPSIVQPLGVGGGSTRGQEMMERGLKTSKLNSPVEYCWSQSEWHTGIEYKNQARTK